MTDVDRRCLSDGAYCAAGADLYRCLGSRLPKTHGDRIRIGFENACDPDDVRWVAPTSLFAQQLRFVRQGEPSSQREIIEAMR